MRRIGRWMINGLTVLSVVLCVGTCVLWARSYWFAEEYLCVKNSWHCEFVSTQGSITLSADRASALDHSEFDEPTGYWRKRPYADHATLSWIQNQRNSPGLRTARSLGAIAWIISDGGRRPGEVWVEARNLYVKDWLLVLLFSLLPGIGLLRKIARRKRSESGCSTCGYDLTGNISGVCPECGSSVAMEPRRGGGL